jgi:hypothetical protein
MDFVRGYETEKGYATHPFGMTFQFPVPDHKKANDPLFNSRADWVSPGFDDELVLEETGPKPARWYTDPPANDGAKVVIADTDHFAPGQGDALWAWKAFIRGAASDPDGLRTDRRHQSHRFTAGRPAV